MRCADVRFFFFFPIKYKYILGLLHYKFYNTNAAVDQLQLYLSVSNKEKVSSCDEMAVSVSAAGVRGVPQLQ